MERQKRIPKIQRRAIKEAEIVKACSERATEKMQQAYVELTNSRRELLELQRELALRSEAGGKPDSIEVIRLAGAIKVTKNRSTRYERLQILFMEVAEVLKDLELQVDAIMQLEWYKYLVRAIPEKRLPRLLASDSPEDMKMIVELVQTIVEKIESKITKDGYTVVEGKQKRRHYEEVVSVMNKECDDARAEEVNALIAEAKMSAAFVKSAPQPVSVSDTNDTDTNLN